MTTREIALHLSQAAARFPFLGKIGPQDLLDVVRLELGHEGALDDFQSYGRHQSMAVGPGTILHVMSGNTPHAALQSLMRGLLLKSLNLCKIPSAGLPEPARFRDALPAELAARVEISPELPTGWIERAEAVVVFGGDDTVAHFRGLVRPGRRFIAHGHKISLGLVFEDPGGAAAAGAARDVSLFDQRGCLSPHCYYVHAGQARAFAEKLADEMEAFNRLLPRSKITAPESAAIRAVRESHEFRAANDPSVAVWKSDGGTDWTVIFDMNPAFTASCLNRVIFVRPLPENWREALSGALPHLGCIAIWPATPENARFAAGLGASRVCAPGQMQFPPCTWHQDGGQNLAPLVRWVDFEPANET
jgi:hypothetical protein